MFIMQSDWAERAGIGARDFFPLACIVPDKEVYDFCLCI